MVGGALLLAVSWVSAASKSKRTHSLGDAAFVPLSHVEFAEGPSDAQALVSGHSPAGRPSAG